MVMEAADFKRGLSAEFWAFKILSRAQSLKIRLPRLDKMVKSP